MLPTGPQPRLPQVDMVFTTGAGPVRIHAELAFTAEQKTAGLMFRRQLGADEGMLFTWAEPAPRCFWMRNTLIPLSAAFVDERGHVINIEEMSPLTDSRHCSTRPARFVLEAPQGWFSAHGVGPGDTLQIRPGP